MAVYARGEGGGGYPFAELEQDLGAEDVSAHLCNALSHRTYIFVLSLVTNMIVVTERPTNRPIGRRTSKSTDQSAFYLSTYQPTDRPTDQTLLMITSWTASETYGCYLLVVVIIGRVGHLFDLFFQDNCVGLRFNQAAPHTAD